MTTKNEAHDLEERARLLSRLGTNAKMIGFREAAALYFQASARCITDLDILEGKIP